MMRTWLPLCCGVMLLNTASADRVEAEARDWLAGQVTYLDCPGEHFIFGVAYIDGSYMERIFYTADSGERPQIHIEFQAPPEADPATGDIAAVEFLLEVGIARSRYAEPVRGQWHVPEQDWSEALRFKYTAWFGTLERRGGSWSARYGGYRRPMLPEDLVEQPGRVCGWFESGE